MPGEARPPTPERHWRRWDHRPALKFPRGYFARTSENLQGILLMILSTASMATMFVAIRKVPGDMHPFEMAFFRTFFGLCFLLTWHAGRRFSGLKTRVLWLHATRGLLNVITMLLFFPAVLITPLVDVTALNFTAPLFASALAIVLLREKVRLHRLLVIAIGVTGVLVILRPGIQTVSLGALLMIASSLVWAVAMMIIKVLTRTESSMTIVFYMAAFMTPLSFISASFFWQWPDLVQLSWLGLIGALGTTGQVSLTRALAVGEVTAVLPLDFLKLVWGSALGYFFFAEIPDAWTWVGGTIIFASTIYLALRESR